MTEFYPHHNFTVVPGVPFTKQVSTIWGLTTSPVNNCYVIDDIVALMALDIVDERSAPGGEDIVVALWFKDSGGSWLAAASCFLLCKAGEQAGLMNNWWPILCNGNALGIEVLGTPQVHNILANDEFIHIDILYDQK